MSAKTASKRSARADAGRRARSLLDEMTLEEKVQQLTGVEPYALMNVELPTRAQLEPLLGGGIGHIAMFSMFQHETTADHARRVNAIQRYLVEETRLGIPAIFHLEALNGIVAPDFTVYPTGIALASTWNVDGVEEMAQRVRRQARGIGYVHALSPVMDVARDPRWGRVHETYGEDALLVSLLSTAFTRGMQGDDPASGVIATGKHFLGFATTEGGQHMAATSVGSRELREVLARPFETAIREADLGSVMNSYSSVDGVPVAASRALLNDLLRDELGFSGTVVADYGAVNGLYDRQGVASDPQAAGIAALEAGLDVELPSAAAYGATLIDAVQRGKVPEHLVDRSVLRVLTDKFAAGLFDHPYVEVDDETLATLARDGAPLATQLARESVVVLSNDGSLPLAQPQRLAVIGPHSENVGVAFPAYTYFGALGLLGASETEGAVKMAGLENLNESLPSAAKEALRYQLEPHLRSGLEAYARRQCGAETLTSALAKHLPATTVVSERGCGVLAGEPADIEAAVTLASTADVTVLALGGRAGWFGAHLTEGEGSDQADVDLPSQQIELARRVAATGRTTIAVVFTGRPFALGALEELGVSIVYAAPGGQAGVDAVAEILCGLVEPSGKLPISLPRHSGQIPVHYNQHLSSGYRRVGSDMHAGYNDMSSRPLFPFGHGLTYSTVDLGELRVRADTIPTDGDIDATVTVTNSGDRRCVETVQFYASHRAAGVTRPALELVGFARVDLDPGQRRRVRIRFSTGQLAYLGIDNEFTFDPGPLELSVGVSSDDIRQRMTVMTTGRAANWGRDRPLLPEVHIE